MDKVTLSNKNITPFGGLNFIYDALSRSGIDKFIDQKIGSRSVMAKYSYADVVLSLFGNTLMDFEDIRQACSKIKVWKTIRINHEVKEVASIFYQPKNCKKHIVLLLLATKEKMDK
nr:hypothetical protein [Pseudopedobacter sp.]